jgi:SAM-dependent methyltransferase
LIPKAMATIKPNDARYYPPKMEQWWLERVGESDVHTLDNLHRNASVLSDHFTVKRDKGFPDYFKKPGHLLAYGIYFLPQSWVRGRFPFLEMAGFRGWELPEADSGEVFRILDVGSGPGSVGLGLLHLLAVLRPGLRVELTAVDQSPHALDAMRACHSQLRDLWPDSSLRTQSKNLRHRANLFYGGRERFDLVVLGFSLNEFCAGMDAAGISGYLRGAGLSLLRKRGMLMVLEPALQETSNLLSQVGELASAEGKGALHYWGPYLHGGKCPLLEAGKYWNHEVRSWRPPDSLEFLNRQMHRRIWDLKFSFLCLSPSPSPLKVPDGSEMFRLVSPVSRMKGFFLMSGVAGDGEVHSYELQYRGLDNAQKRALKAMSRGDVLEVVDLVEAGGSWRIPGFSSITKHCGL